MLRGKGITEEELLEHFNGGPNQKIVTYLLGREGIAEEYKSLPGVVKVISNFKYK